MRLATQSNFTNFSRSVLTYIKRNYGYFHAIMVTHPNKNLFSEYMTATKDAYNEIIGKHSSVKNKKEFVIYNVGGQIGIVYFWIRENCEESVDSLAQILLANTIKLQR
jgi:hypothetical protein